MIPIKLKLISGVGGARIDFVAGWLGTLPGWINNQWQIDPITGQSNGFMRMTKPLDHGNNDISTLLKDLNLELSPHAKFYWAGACHGFYNKIDISNLLNSGSVELWRIQVRDVDINEIIWNHIVKTFMSHDTRISRLQDQTPYLIDRRIKDAQPSVVIDDQLRIEFMHDLINQIKQGFLSMVNNLEQSTVPAKIIEYREIASVDGSYYLQQMFDLNVPEACHKMWANMIPLSFSPDSIQTWGHCWRRADYNLL